MWQEWHSIFVPFFEGACPSCRAPMWATSFKNEAVFVNNTLSKTKTLAILAIIPLVVS